MSVMTVDIQDFKGLVQDSLHMLQTDTKTKQLMNKAIQHSSHTPETVHAEFQKQFEKIPDDAHAAFQLHLSNDRAVAFTVMGHTVPLPNVRISNSGLQSFKSSVTHGKLSRHGFKVAEPLKMPLDVDMLLKADMQEIQQELEVQLPPPGPKEVSLEKEEAGMIILGPPIIGVLMGIIFLAIGIPGVAMESYVVSGWVLITLGILSILGGVGVGFAAYRAFTQDRR